MGESKQVTVYVPKEMVVGWDEERAELNMSRSEYVQSMVCAGRKKFSLDHEVDETKRELRRERNELKNKLESARDDINDLEVRAYGGEREALIEVIEREPGITYADLVRELGNDLPARVSQHLDDIVGEQIERENNCFYPTDFSQ